MKIDWSEPGVPVSIIAHAALLVASLVALSSTPPFADAEETVSVEVISADQLSAMTKGIKTAKEVQPTPKPRVDKVATVEELKPTQGTDQTDVPTPPAKAPELSDNPPPPPLPPTRPADEPKPQPKPEPQTAAQQPQPEPPKVDAEIPKPPPKPKPQPLDTTKIAQLLEQKKVQEQPKPPKPPAKEKAEPNFAKTTSEIEKLLVSHEKAQSTGSTGAQLQRTASLGTQTGNSPKLSPSMRDAIVGLLRDQVGKCFDLPPGIDETKIRQGVVRVVFNEDGTLAERPEVANSSADPGVRAVAGALQRAIMRCAPYRIPAQFLPYFDQWKDVVFEPPNSLG